MIVSSAAGAIREHVDAFNTRDLHRLIAGFTHDGLWITGRSVARGHAELTDLFDGAMRGLLPTLTVHNLVADGDRVACEMTETLTAYSEERTFAIAAFFRLRDNLIHSAKVYREGSAELG